MASKTPTLMVNVSNPQHLYCSRCGFGFALDGTAQYLLDSFVLHVRTEHRSDEPGCESEPGVEKDK
jgi:hypothetical protein